MSQINLRIVQHFLSFFFLFSLILSQNNLDRFRSHLNLWEQINHNRKSNKGLSDVFLSSSISSYATYPLSFITQVSSRGINSKMLNGPLAQHADQTALTRNEQFLSTKPCLHGSSSFIQSYSPQGRKQAITLCMLGMDEQLLPSGGQH